jgi:NitT/TauT family transport system permease protein
MVTLRSTQRAPVRADRPGEGGEGRSRRWLRNAAPPLSVAVLLVVAWDVGARLLGTSLVPTPVQSGRQLVENFADASFRESVVSTLELLVISYVLAVVVGAVAGFIVGILPFWTDVFSPLVYALYSIPKVTLYPLFLLFLGIGEVSKIGFAFAHGVLPMMLIVMGATTTVDKVHLKMAASLRMRMVDVVRRILIPSVVPALATGMRLSFGLCFLGLILAEMFSGGSGIGYELLSNVTLVRMGNIVGQVVLVAAIALVPTVLLRMLEQRVEGRYQGLSGKGSSSSLLG